MKLRTIMMFCFALLLALFPAGAYQASASPQPEIIPAAQPAFDLQSPPLAGGSGVAATQAGVEYFSAPAAAFLPLSQDADFENTGRWIKVNNVIAGFRAPVYLPNGSQIQKISACFADYMDTYTATLQLMVTPLDNGNMTTEMASVESRTDDTATIYEDNSVFPTVNNNLAFAYYLFLTLPASIALDNSLFFCGASVTYKRQPNDRPSISIAGAAFDRPFEDGYNGGHNQWGGRLNHYHRPLDSNPGTYLAPINLPHGSVINKMTIYYQDDDNTGAINVYLEHSYLGSNLTMASAASADTGYQTTDTTIISPTIDNINYTYWAYVTLPVGSYALWAVTIEYTPPAIDGDKYAISNAAFTPNHANFDYQNHGRWLFHLHDDHGAAEDGVYVAPVQLPQGVRIDSLWATFYDGTAVYSGTAVLVRQSLADYEVVSELNTTGSSGYTTPNDGYPGHFCRQPEFCLYCLLQAAPCHPPRPARLGRRRWRQDEHLLHHFLPGLLAVDAQIGSA